MIWCLVIPALLSLVLALLAMIVDPPDPRTVRPGPLLRGCLALSFLMLALGLGTAALAIANGWVSGT